MRCSARLLSVPTVLLAGMALAGCGGSGDGASCDGEVCVVRSDGPGVYELDELGTEVEVSDLGSGSVRVRINSEAGVVRSDASPARIRGFLVSAAKATPDRVELRIER